MLNKLLDLDYERLKRPMSILLFLALILSLPVFFLKPENGLIFNLIGFALLICILGIMAITFLMLRKDIKKTPKEERWKFLKILCVVAVFSALINFLIPKQIMVGVLIFLAVVTFIIGTIILIYLRSKKKNATVVS